MSMIRTHEHLALWQLEIQESIGFWASYINGIGFVFVHELCMEPMGHSKPSLFLPGTCGKPKLFLRVPSGRYQLN